MRNFVKLSVLAVLAVAATVASAADLEFHGYSRAGFGVASRGGNQACFGLGSADAKLRLGNECDWVIEPTFEMSFTKLDDKSAWGIHLLPGMYSGFAGTGFGTTPGANRANEELPIAYKEWYFFGRNVPQLGGGEIWLGRRYFDRQYLGAINDSFLEAQDGVGAGVYDIKLGGPKLSFSVIYDPFTSSANVDTGLVNANGDAINVPGGTVDAAAYNDRNLGLGVHVDSIQTFNKDSNLQFWGHVYVPIQVTSGVGKVATKRKTGFSASATHVAGFGAAGNLTLALRFDDNAYTDQQGAGGGGRQGIKAVAVYGVSFPSARTSLDAVAEYRHKKNVTTATSGSDPKGTNDWFEFGFRTDTQLSGPFRFLLEAGVDSTKDKDQGDEKTHTLFKITPCVAINGGNDPGSSPTFRLFYTYASWNKDATGDVLSGAGSSASTQYAGKTSGGSIGLQAQGGW